MRRALATALLALSLGIAPAIGADPSPSTDASPVVTTAPGNALVHALSRIPVTPAVYEGMVGWVDLEAVIASRPGAADPATFADLVALLDADDPSARLWMAALSGVATGAGQLFNYLFAGGEEWPLMVGFDFTDVDTITSFGSPPGDGLMLTGTFDPDAIGAALAARAFTSQPADGFTLWCRGEGCDEGFRIDIEDRQLGDPFGGHLGRKQPLAVSGSELLSSASIETVEGMLDAAADRTVSLADDPAWTGLARLVGEEDGLIQVTFLPGTLISFDLSFVLGEQTTPEAVQELLAELAEDFEPIAPSPLLVFADAATEAEQVVTVALAYGTLEDAQRAADVLPRRLETMSSLRTRQPWREMLADRGVEDIEADAVELSDGGAAARLVFRAPLASDQPDGDGRYVTSSILYRLFMSMIVSRDTDWLVSELPTFE